MKVNKETGEILDDDFVVNSADKATIEKLIEHPCEELFEIESGTTAITIAAPRNTELVEVPQYDGKDMEIEEQYQEVYDKAMDAFDESQSNMEGVEGKHRARNSEVAVTMLNTALQAAKEKANLKQHKDKLNPAMIVGDNAIINNTQVNLTTSELVSILAQEKDPVNNKVINAEVEEIVEDVKPVRNTIKRKKKPE